MFFGGRPVLAAVVECTDMARCLRICRCCMFIHEFFFKLVLLLLNNISGRKCCII